MCLNSSIHLLNLLSHSLKVYTTLAIQYAKGRGNFHTALNKLPSVEKAITQLVPFFQLLPYRICPWVCRRQLFPL